MSDTQEFRIDDLAQRSGVSVDTIRFYQREGLLHAPTRRGRTVVYGPGHLHRLDQIRDLQSRHLSLAAIRNLLDRAQLGLAESLFAAGEGDYTPAQLATAADVDRGLVDELEQAGVLRSPNEFGRESYDNADLRLLSAIRRLLDLGLPRPLVVRMGEIYASSFAKMQEEVLTLFTSGDGVLKDQDMTEFHQRIADQLGEVLKPVQSILDYSHTRSVQTMTMQALRDTADGISPTPTPPAPTTRARGSRRKS
ncbi:MAG: hypothetical protein QOG53_574 [Frankiales bacterium]|jgi:DNA-binding transcriptional MerR regulator|nr:hypothetical protein [Frankiales bacterium]